MLVAPGAGLAGARVVVDQVNLYDGKAELRKHVGETVTDDQGFFPAQPTGTINGLILIDASGGTYTDPINGARIQLDPSVHLKALHWLGIFEDRSESMYVTPVHALVEARFRYKMTLLGDTTRAVNDAYMHLDNHFGGLDWEKVIPADLSVPVASPTDEVRAAFVLGGLDMLAEGIRTASNSTPQVVNLLILVEAAARDLSDHWLDGNDSNANALGSGLQVGDCPPADATCAVPPAGCQLGTCRPLCDIYANTYRSITADSISRFIGPKASPSMWNRTTLGSEDARAFTDSITRNTDVDLFNDACAETQHRVPPTILWEMAPPDGALQGGTIGLRVHAVANDSNKLPTVSFPSYPDTDGDPTNDFATVTVDTRAATGGIDGPLTVTAIATDVAGNRATSTRTFQIDDTPPVVTLDSNGLYVDGANVWWTATPGPTLHGTVTDAHPGTVQVVIGGSIVAFAEVNGTEWSAQLPVTALSSSGNDVTIVATDQVGNTASKVQTLRLDTTPPSMVVEHSPVVDEIGSTFHFDPSKLVATHVPGDTIPPPDLSTTGMCPTINKHAHLLFAPAPDGSQAVLGSSGPPNPLSVNVTISNDGVGTLPDSEQYRVLFKNGTELDELLPWTAMPPGTAVGSNAHYMISLYRDGDHAIPQLGTTNGEYHIQLRATDRFGRTASQERCWNHKILGPPLAPTSMDSSGQLVPGGAQAVGFPQALFSTKLNPGPGETGDFAEKFLNIHPSPPAGAALWRARFQNYLGVPVYVKVQVSQNTQGATVLREFKIMNSLMNFRNPRVPINCKNSPCVSKPPPASIVEYGSTITTTVTGIKFKVRLFQLPNNEIASETATCDSSNPPGNAPCVVARDDGAQTYVFLIPARSPQGSLPEYSFLTYLDPTSPAGNGTNVTMAPADASHPDNDPAPYTEFQFPPLPNQGPILTGKVMGPDDQSENCVAEDRDASGFFCTQVASFQRYRAVARVQFQLNEDLAMNYSFGATVSLPSSDNIPGALLHLNSAWSTDEVTLP